MKKRNILAALFVLVFFIFGVNVSADNNCTSVFNTSYGKWTKINNSVLGGSGNLQGSAFLSKELNGIDHKDRIYSFKQLSDKTANTFGYYDIASNTWTVVQDSFTWAPQTHMGSATFGPSVVSSYVGSDGNTYNCSIPFVYVTGHAYLDAEGNVVDAGTSGSARYITCVALDLENSRVVNVFAFPNRTDDCIMAFDFEGRRMWVIGYTYEVSSGMAPYVIDEYRKVDMEDFLSGNPTRWNYSDIACQEVTLDPNGGTSSSFSVPSDGSIYCLRMQGGGPDEDGIQRTLECGAVQDAFYHDNHLYIVTGRGSDYNRSEVVKVHCYYVAENAHDYDVTVVTATRGESQGLVFDGTNIWVVIGGGPEGDSRFLMKYSPSASPVYDSMNSKQPSEISSGTYSITDGYELVWFLQQVYAGRTDINAVLANDIDMSGITLPTSYYVYEKNNAQGKRSFEAQYAFRGTFDGNHKTISNLLIGSTPYNNDGLFPWVIDATIKDFTVTGNITLTTAKTNNSGIGVSNVGLVGTAEGNCTITGINVVDFAISNPNSVSNANVNSLIGNNQTDEGSDVTTGNQYKQDHGAEGTHEYNVNGICIYTHETQDGMFQEAETDDDGVYQIKNAGNLIWFANGVKDGSVSASSNAILTANINLEGAKYGSFPGIGSATNMYKGTFDGNGKKIENFYMSVTSNTMGLFCAISTNAVVKNFSISGEMTATNSTDKYFIGAVVGRADENSLVQDITSSVNIRVEGRVRSGLGGVVGATMATKTAVINRCRYNGTITVTTTTTGTTPQGIGGVCGNHRSGQMNNCLFDGKIITTVNDSNSNANLNVGGIAGATSDGGTATFNNCFSNGELQIQDNTYEHCGIFLGYAAGTTKVNNCYYTDSRVVVSQGNVVATAYGDVLKVTKASALTDGTLLYKLQNGAGNWIAADEYPIPGEGPLVEQPAHTHEYGADGFCVDGDGAMQKPELDGGYYMITNRGNLWWFMNYVNGTLASDDPDTGVHKDANAKLANAINMEQQNWMGINNFAGIFDGQGNTISGFKVTYSSSNKHGFFNNTSGTSSTKLAQIRNLVLEGEMTVNGGFAFSGAVVGAADAHTLVEDVVSKVSVTVVSGRERYTGGVVGSLMANTTTANRCRFSGTITVNTSYQDPNNYRQGVGGVVGESRNGTVTNCLFDGKIITLADNTNVAGILGAATNGVGSIVRNCLSTGEFVLAGNSNGQCAAIFGACQKEQQAGQVKIYDSYAAYTGDSPTVDCIGVTTYNKDGDAVKAYTERVDYINSGWANAAKYTIAKLGAQDWAISEGKVLPSVNKSYLVLDDEVDSMPVIASMTNYENANKIIYARDDKYMAGMISVCLPIALNQSTLPSEGSKYLKYKGVEDDGEGGSKVVFQEVKAVPAGVPCFIQLGADFTESYWVVEADKSSYSSTVTNPSYGIMGSFDKEKTGIGNYKLNDAGTALTNTTENSNCYPYRAYLKLPQSISNLSAMSVMTEQ